jgi:hypothetical protein
MGAPRRRLGDSRLAVEYIGAGGEKEKRVAARIGSSGVFGNYQHGMTCTKQKPNMHYYYSSHDLLDDVCLSTFIPLSILSPRYG